jgi:uncharacterized protein (TIGR02001 family)
MFKSLTAATVLSLALVAPAMASDAKVQGFIEGSSDYLYRGQSVTNDKPAVSAGLQITDLVVDGTFASVKGTTVDVGNLDRNGKIRAEYEVGYVKAFANRYSLAVSVARVQNPILYTEDYAEARLTGAVRLTDKLFATGEYAQILTTKVGNDKYAALGLEYKGLVVDELSAGVKASYQSYDLSGRSEFNNAELYATYALTKNVEAFGSYSWGGKSITHATDAFSFLDYRASSLRDQGQIGVRVRF